jgi:hypothetical protein
MRKPHILDAIEKVMGRRPSISGSGETESEEDYNELTWQVGIDSNHTAIFGEPEDKPKWEDVKKAMDELEAEYATFEFQRKRKPEYPKIEDQLDLLYHKGIDGWKEEIQKVKDKYPKPVVEAVVEEPKEAPSE